MRFDYFIAVDWSAKNAPSPKKPSKDAIWVAEGKADETRVSTRYFRTRSACFGYLQKRLRGNVKKGLRTFIGFDIVYAYPAGLAKALKLKPKPGWQRIWELWHHLIEDNERNRNNRFQVGAELNRRIKTPLGPFWGVPAGQSGIFLGPKKDFRYPVKTKKVSLAEKRLVEMRCPGMQPTWKLAYTGSVGSQGLMGIPYLYRLRFLDEALAPVSKVWPFEGGFVHPLQVAEETLVVHAEIWPSLFPQARKDKINDRGQVKTVVQWLRSEQGSGRLGGYFTPPEGLSEAALLQCEDEEGWVLGVR